MEILVACSLLEAKKMRADLPMTQLLLVERTWVSSHAADDLEIASTMGALADFLKKDALAQVTPEKHSTSDPGGGHLMEEK